MIIKVNINGKVFSGKMLMMRDGKIMIDGVSVSDITGVPKIEIDDSSGAKTV